MADIEKSIKDLEEIKSKLIPTIARMFGSGFSSIFACEQTEEKINNAVSMLKSQQAEIERMKGEGKSPTWKKGKAFCGNCGGCLENKDRLSTYYVQSIRFCKWCGVPVDWSNG